MVFHGYMLCGGSAITLRPSDWRAPSRASLAERSLLRSAPTLVCQDLEAEIEFCERVLNAEVRVRRPGPDGNTIHAALVVGVRPT